LGDQRHRRIRRLMPLAEQRGTRHLDRNSRVSCRTRPSARPSESRHNQGLRVSQHERTSTHGAGKHLRVLFMFDPRRQAVLLTGGNKQGNWVNWYHEAIPRAEQLYAVTSTVSDRGAQSNEQKGTYGTTIQRHHRRGRP